MSAEGGPRMWALRWHDRNDVRLEEIPKPPGPGPGEIELRVLWCGICGTDIEEWRHGPITIPAGAPHPLSGAQAPITLGHELCGEVVEVGSGTTSLQPGDRVAVDGAVFCGECRQCVRHRVNLCVHRGQVGLTSDGGLAGFVNVPAEVCLLLPREIAAEGGAIAETLSVGVRALRRGQLVPGEHEDYSAALGLLAAGAVQYEPLLTRIKLVDSLQHGLQALVERPEDHIKILVEP